MKKYKTFNINNIGNNKDLINNLYNSNINNINININIHQLNNEDIKSKNYNKLNTFEDKQNTFKNQDLK